MGLPEELYSAMLEVSHCARHHKVLRPLAYTMIDIAPKVLNLCQRDEKGAMVFAAILLTGPPNLRAFTMQLPEPVASAFWKLISLLEYLASHVHQQVVDPPGENILQPKGLLEGARSHQEAGLCCRGF